MMIEKLRQFTYRRGLVSFVDRLGVRKILARVYCFLVAPRGVLRVQIGAHKYRFHARRPEELRSLEGPIINPTGNNTERETLDLLVGFLKPGDAVYDVGANVGLYSCVMARLVGSQGQVFAFEPDTRNYRRLRENLALNGLMNVLAVGKALGEGTSSAHLYMFENDPWRSTLVRPQTDEMSRGESVDVVAGDQFRRDKNLPLPVVVKIDVEGSEYAVIRGLRETLADPACLLVCCEIHPTLLPKGLQPRDIVELLESLGFVEIDVRPSGIVEHAVCRKRQAYLRGCR